MTAVKKLSEGIFRDRRSPANAIAVKPVVCRRSHPFREGDSTPWWLKVNYVTSEPANSSPPGDASRPSPR